jgi:competence protein ComEA
MNKLIVSLLILGSLFATPFLSAKDDGPELGIAQVNINTASVEKLAEVLSGVGLSKAQEIVNHREAYGNFHVAGDLVEVKGIGERIVLANEGRIILSE